MYLGDIVLLLMRERNKSLKGAKLEAKRCRHSIYPIRISEQTYKISEKIFRGSDSLKGEIILRKALHRNPAFSF